MKPNSSPIFSKAISTFLSTSLMVSTLAYTAGSIGALGIAAATSTNAYAANSATTSRSSCSQSYSYAEQNQILSTSAPTQTMRFIYAQNASHAWSQVAAACSSSFAKGTIQSATTAYYAKSLSSHANGIEVSYAISTPTVGSLSAVDSSSTQSSSVLSLTAKQAQSVALAFDRAGFALEVLSARASDSDEDAIESLSNSLQADGEQFALLSEKIAKVTGTKYSDTRLRAYSTTLLTSGALATATDSYTGISASIESVILVEAALESLNGISSQKTSETTSSSNSNTKTNTKANSKTRTAILKQRRITSRYISYYLYSGFEHGFPAKVSLFMQ